MPVPICVVDAFTDRAFRGNPAAVCTLDGPAPGHWMQDVAAELNLSETAFVVPRADGDHDLRWFTPRTEVDLCGHATLATAHVLGGAARFHTRSGLLTCRAGDRGWIEMDFPSLLHEPVLADHAALDALGVSRALTYARSRFDVLVEVATADEVRGLVPDLALLAGHDGRGWIVTAPGDRPGIDFVSRFFAPAVGVPEDPVTGSAHCVLAPFWAARVGHTELVGEQVSPRGGVVKVRLDGDRVTLAGRAVTVWEGHLLADP